MRLLADLGDWLPLIVGAIALISWIANKVKERGGVAVAVQGDQAADDGGRVQAEIDRFLQEVRGGGGQKAAANVVASEDAFETPGEPARQAPRPPLAAQEPDRPARRPALSERHTIGDRRIDTDVDDHVFDHLPVGRMGRLVEEDLGHGFDQSVAAHLGSRAETGTELVEVRQEEGALTAEHLVGLLTRPDGIRQAVLVHEILSRPKGRRGRSGL